MQMSSDFFLRLKRRGRKKAQPGSVSELGTDEGYTYTVEPYVKASSLKNTGISHQEEYEFSSGTTEDENEPYQKDGEEKEFGASGGPTDWTSENDLLAGEEGLHSLDIVGSCTHTISITTGSTPNAGTNTDVFIILYEEKKNERVELKDTPLRSGTTETFKVKLKSTIQPITSIGIGHNKRDSSPWFCEKVEVKCHKTHITQIFPCNRWLSSQKQNITTLTENFMKEDPVYTITVSTGTKTNAGTDANVSIILYGKNESNHITYGIPRDKCKLGGSYSFQIAIPFVVTCVEVGHDNTGESPDWLCDQVIVCCQNTDVQQVFPCKKWLSKTKRDCSTRRRLYELRDNDVLHRLCKQYGRSSSEVSEACKQLRFQIMSCSRSFKDVIPTYRLSAPDDIVFLVFTAPNAEINIELPRSLKSFEIVYQNINENDNEDNEIRKLETDLLFSEKDDHRADLTDILQKNSSHLMDAHSNISIITASPVKSKGFTSKKHNVKRKPCIVFYVRSKGYIPIQEEELPTFLGSYKTDVREGAFKFYNDPEPYMQNLKIGCSIGDVRYSFLGGTGGTLGAFVNLANEKIGCITSAHTLLSSDRLFECKDSKRDIPDSQLNTIYQPAPMLFPNTERKPFGRVTSVVYETGKRGDTTGVEVGLITIQDPKRYPDNGQFPKIPEGYTVENQFNYTSGDIFTSIPEEIGNLTFYKYGAKTGLTRGAFRLQGSAVRTGSMDLCPKCELFNQIEICSVDTNPFAEPGDSGALVFIVQNNDTDDLRAIGILTGGDTSCTMFYVTPIWDVLKALDLPLQLMNFSGHIPMMIEDENNKIEEVESKIGNLEKKVDRISLEMNTNFEKLFAHLMPNS